MLVPLHSPRGHHYFDNFRLFISLSMTGAIKASQLN